MSNINEKNSLWLALNFVFPKTQEKGETYVNKSIKFKVFVDEVLVGSIGKEDKQFYQANMKLGCKVDVLKGDIEAAKISSSFSWIVGESFATLYLNKDTSKKINLDFNNQNKIEIYDERDWELIDEDGNDLTKKEE